MHNRSEHSLVHEAQRARATVESHVSSAAEYKEGPKGVGFLGGLVVFGARTRGTHQTHLSKTARPLAKWPYWRPTFLLLVATVVVIRILAIFANPVPIFKVHIGDSWW